jgi:hypothetical protein
VRAARLGRDSGVIRACMAVSIGLGEYAAGIFIIAIVAANAALGVYQEMRAGAALDDLTSLITAKTLVVREGRKMEVNRCVVQIAHARSGSTLAVLRSCPGTSPFW